MSKNFQIGDLAMLKSGGPLLILEKATNDGEDWWCWWIGKDGATILKELFETETLQKITTRTGAEAQKLIEALDNFISPKNGTPP